MIRNAEAVMQAEITRLKESVARLEREVKARGCACCEPAERDNRTLEMPIIAPGNVPGYDGTGTPTYDGVGQPS